jgi:hypothetical protein
MLLLNGVQALFEKEALHNCKNGTPYELAQTLHTSKPLLHWLHHATLKLQKKNSVALAFLPESPAVFVLSKPYRHPPT